MEKQPQPWYQVLARTAVFCVLLNWALQNPALAGRWLAAVQRLAAPFAVGAALAFVINVPLCCIEARMDGLPPRLRRPMALTFLGLFLIILLSAVVGVLAPQLRLTILSLQENLPQMWDRFWQWAEVQRRHWPFLGELLSLREDQALWEAVRRQIEGQSRSLLNTTVDAAAGALSALANLGIGAVLAIYILAQKESLCHKCKMVLLAWLPRPAARRIWETGKLAAQTFAAFLSGQCLEACILGGMFAVTLWVCHMPYALFISLLIAVSALVPIVGSVFGCLAGALLIACEDPVQAAWFVVLFLALQQIEGNLIYPRVVGGKVGLPSLWVLAAVTVGGKLFGVPGMIIMIPLCAVAYTLASGATLQKLRQKQQEEQDPFRPPTRHR